MDKNFNLNCNMELKYIILILLFLGSIPFGYFINKIFFKKRYSLKLDINIGATNVLRTGNKMIGYLHFIFRYFEGCNTALIFIKIYYLEFYIFHHYVFF